MVSSVVALEEYFSGFWRCLLGNEGGRENTSRNGTPLPPHSCREDQHHVVDWDLLLGIETQQQNH